MSPDRPDTAESPAVRPRERSTGHNEILGPATLNGEPTGKGRRWSMEGTGTWAGVALCILGLMCGGAMWVSQVSDRTTELRAWKAEHEKSDAALHDSYEHRLQTLETAQQVQVATTSGKVDTVISKLDALAQRVGNIEHAMDVGEPYRVRQPRSRPIHAPARVDQP